MATITAINPATGATIRTYPEPSQEEVKHRLSQAGQAFAAWRHTAFRERATVMRALAAALRARAAEHAVLMAQEMGKPVTQGRVEIDKCASVCEYYAGQAERFLAPELIATEARKSYVAFEPLGVVLAIMPWNFPFWQVFRAAVPALMAGNTMVLKHATNVPGCALAIEQLFEAAGAPEGIFHTLLVSSDRVPGLIEQPQIAAVTLTGSTGAGQAVAAKAGALLKKTVLELGGSDPYIILEDADLEPTVEACVASRLINAGQSCIAAKRFIVVGSIRSRFEAAFAERMRAQTVGDPLREDVTVGPLARRDLRDGLHGQVARSCEQGATRLLGGEVPSSPGAFYPPTVLTDVKPGMAAFDEETFGPVAAIVGVDNESQAIEAANHSPFGLGAAVFTKDVARGERIAATQLDAGSCFVNAFVRSDPRLPFGGVKQSGYGRELSSFGIREFVNIKTVYVK